jgi:hypothetical protein
MKPKNIFVFISIFASLNCSGQILGGPYNGEFSDNTDGAYWFLTAVISSINATTTTITIVRLRNPDKPDKYKTNAIFAILSGSAQTAMGIANVFAKRDNAYLPASLNIGLGATTIVTSVMRLARRKTLKETNLSYNFFYTPNVYRFPSTVGIRLIRKFS